jgi:hypothetical protein
MGQGPNEAAAFLIQGYGWRFGVNTIFSLAGDAETVTLRSRPAQLGLKLALDDLKHYIPQGIIFQGKFCPSNILPQTQYFV